MRPVRRTVHHRPRAWTSAAQTLGVALLVLLVALGFLALLLFAADAWLTLQVV